MTTREKEQIALQAFITRFGKPEVLVDQEYFQVRGIDFIYKNKATDLKTEIGENYMMQPGDYLDEYLANNPVANDTGLVIELQQKKKNEDWKRTFESDKLTEVLVFYVKDKFGDRFFLVSYSSILDYLNSFDWARKYKVKTSFNGTGKFLKVEASDLKAHRF